MLEKGEDLDLDEGRDLAAAGGAFGAAEDSELSLRCLGEALKHELPRERRLAVFRTLGRTLKSLGRREEARGIWEQARAEFPDDELCRLELAMHYEHRLRNCDGALEAAREALGILRRKCRGAGSNAPLARERDCECRVERLKRKVAHRKERGGQS
jgi:tetratricopeptide (TPR) repeat protein